MNKFIIIFVMLISFFPAFAFDHKKENISSRVKRKHSGESYEPEPPKKKLKSDVGGISSRVKRKHSDSISKSSNGVKRKASGNMLKPERPKKKNKISQAKFFLQRPTDAKAHPTNGGIETHKRIIEIEKYLKEKFPKSFEIIKIDDLEKYEISQLLNNFDNAEILKFLAAENKNSERRKTLRANEDLVLDDLTSVEVALKAAAQHVRALKRILDPDDPTKRILSIARPPSHHASHRETKGFCLLNYISILLGSKYFKGNALIIDFDIHQGDGTEEILDKYASKFKKSVQFISAHVETPLQQKRGEKNFFPNDYYRPKVANKSFIHNVTVDDSSKFSYINISKLIINKITEISNNNKKWKPSILLLSAGFDGHINDPFGGQFSSKDYYSLVKEILKTMARAFGQEEHSIPVLALLEGGYSIEGLKSSIEELFRGLCE